MRTLLTIMRKDLRLLWRDRAGLIFLSVAPIIVISVAGFSLANFYGADPTGQTAYEFPFVDEDGGPLSQTIRDRLAQESSIHLHVVATRAEAERMVRDKHAGSALVIPRGTDAALHNGEPVALVLYVDSAKYLERLNVRARLLEVGDAVAAEQRRRIVAEAEAQRARVREEIDRLQAAIGRTRETIDAAWREAQQTRAQAITTVRGELERTRRAAEEDLTRQLDAAAAAVQHAVETDMAAVQRPVRAYLQTLAEARVAFAAWLARLQELAGSHAADIPPPPAFPEIPPDVSRLLADGVPVRVSPPQLRITLPRLPAPVLPPLPDPPKIALPEIALPELPAPPGTLGIQEINLSGGPLVINTFDQNVPGFSVTFLLLGMLLGVSLGLLDERDWGTLERLRAMPIATANVLVGKLLARFLVGLVQMVILFAVGWVAFGISLGPQPWALLLPTVGIVFAGTAFGLVVAAVATSREGVLPVGSIVIVTMAAVGGCWWPIDLEPRWMRTVALAFPTTWAMDAFNDLMIRRRTFTAAVLPTAVMLGYGMLYLGLGVFLFSRRLRHRRA